MPTETFVGLDVHRKTVVACVKDPQGKVLNRETLGPSKQELRTYLARFPGPKNVVVEACTMWAPHYDAAATVAKRVVLAHPYKTRLIADASLKSDKVDAEALAELLRLNGIPEAYAPDEATRNLRQLTRDRYYYKGLETSIKNHIYGILLRTGTPYEDGILNKVLRREDLRTLGNPDINRGLTALAKLELTTLDSDNAIHRHFKENRDAQLLESLPGIGELSALTLAAFITPITRFPNHEKLASYCGLVPTNHQSGDRSYQGHLKPDASRLLKTVLIECAWAHRQHADRTSDVVKIGNRVARRRGRGKGAVAAAHKLLKIVYAVLRRGTPYTPERPSRERNGPHRTDGGSEMSADRRSGPVDAERTPAGTSRE